MDKRLEPTQGHCYTNPSFCRQSECIPEDSDSADLPPPPQFQVDDLPPPPALQPATPQYGQSNPAFHGSPEVDIATTQPDHNRSIAALNRTTTNAERYCYIEEQQPSPPASTPKRYGSLPLGNARAYAYRTHRYEYIHDDATVQVQVAQQQQQQLHQQQQQQQQQQMAAVASSNSSRYEYIEQTQTPPPPRLLTTPLRQQVISSAPSSIRASVRSYRSTDAHYTSLAPDGVAPHDPAQWTEDDTHDWNNSRRQINTPRGRYTSLPMQDEEPPNLPERNAHEMPSQHVNATLATQKLHEILTTPRKPRTRSQGDPLSPVNSPKGRYQLQPAIHNAALVQRSAYTPGCSPSGAGQRAMNSPAHPQHQQQQQHQATPQNRVLSPRGSKGLTTSTPNKETPSARRCLPLNDHQASTPTRRYVDDSGIHYGRTGMPTGQPHRLQIEEDAVIYSEKKAAGFYQGPEAAFIARTAVVPPLSPQMSSDANTTLMSNTEKSDRKNAPIILALVGILTCGLAIYLSYTQGRRYYYDSAISCGACCALAGVCRSMRRTWTGLGLAGLSALSCAGLLLLAAKSPRPGTPIHDITAGALCGVSLLGAALALLALVEPRCTFGRHRRVHSWIPRYQP
ncbi:atrophin-1-like [Phymastichus coffea]|uniref:atrophin-1-like n=1 Tax=Phymastichus coffea TaxID=108790 RepID=UPI00273B769F|nr:atrophin-1-like [Phymastichus coffea]